MKGMVVLEKIEFKVSKYLQRIATEDQNLRELVGSVTESFETKEQAVKFILNLANPGVRFEYSYYPKPFSIEKTDQFVCGTLYCDDFLNGGEVDLSKLEKVANARLSDPFGRKMPCEDAL